MLTLPADMVGALTYAHYQRVTCTPYTFDGYGSPVFGVPLLVVDGQMSQDGEPPVRRSAQFSVAVPALSTAAEVQDLGEELVAGGVLVQMAWTVTLMDGRTFTVNIGNLRTEEADWTASEGTINIQAYDLGQAVADDRFLSPRSMSGVTKRVAIETLLEETVGSVTFGAGVPTDSLYPVTWDVDRDAAVTELATALGAWWWWGASGGWQVNMVPTPTTVPSSASWVVPAHAGVEDSAGSAKRDGVYNAVAVTGKTPEGDTTTTPFAVVYDDDPASPTYWDGPFGHKPRFYSSPVLTTDAQCEAAGGSLLVRGKGITRGLTFTVPAHPGLEPGDTVSFASGTPAGVFAVDTIDLPLNGSAMKVTGRRVA